MARINAYEKTTVLDDNDVFLLDGTGGTKNITARNLGAQLIANRYGLDLNLLYDLIDISSNFSTSILTTERRSHFRGKKLISPPSDYLEVIDSGKFTGLFVGDYWEDTINVPGTTILWQIVDFDYWLGSGRVKCEKHHVVIMPTTVLYKASMNDTDTTEGGYVGSKMYKEGLNQAKEMANNYFGKSHILTYESWICNAVKNNIPSGRTWLKCTVELPDEMMIAGTNIYLPASTGSIVPERTPSNIGQLSFFKITPNPIARQTFWLRDVASNTSFCYFGSGNFFQRHVASKVYGVRPVFGLCKANA